jgi:hypothetical protein
MDYKEDLDKTGGATAKIHKIRITLTSRNVKPLEKCKSGSNAVEGRDSEPDDMNARHAGVVRAMENGS